MNNIFKPTPFIMSKLTLENRQSSKKSINALSFSKCNFQEFARSELTIQAFKEMRNITKSKMMFRILKKIV